MNTGEKIKQDLGLSKFPYAVIQKLIDFPYQFFIITIDSRRPSINLTYSRIKNIKSSSLDKIVFKGEVYKTSKFKVTPPIELHEFMGILPSKGLVFIRDIAGEYLINNRLYECKNNKFKQVKR